MDQTSFLKKIESLSVEDFMTFVDLAQLMSVRELARRRNRTPSSVSRSLAKLESVMEQKLMARSANGVTLTEDGHRLLEVLLHMLEVADGLRGASHAAEQLYLGSISFLSNRLVSLMVHRLHPLFPDIRVLDFPPDELVANGIRGAFNAALHLGTKDWPQSWAVRKIGDVKWMLCVRAGHPLTKKKNLNVDEILEFPFVYPVYWGRGGIVVGDDNFPISIFKRRRGFATSTAEAAALMLLHNDQIGFLPDLIVLEEIQRGRLVQIAPTLFNVVRPLYLAARADVFTQKRFQTLANEFTLFLEQLGTGAP